MRGRGQQPGIEWGCTHMQPYDKYHVPITPGYGCADVFPDFHVSNYYTTPETYEFFGLYYYHGNYMPTFQVLTIVCIDTSHSLYCPL